MKTQTVRVGELALNDRGAFKIGPFGSSLKKTELVGCGIPVAGIENVLPNKFVKGFRRFITPDKFRELSDYEILSGDVLVTTMGTIGRAACAPADIDRVIFDSHLFRMRVDTRRVFPPYLCHALNSDLVARQLSRMARGAIMEGLNTSILRECSIPLPDLSEQQRIAARLEQADRLRRTRRYALELSDTFLPAAFLELFGDWESAAQEYPVKLLGEVVQPDRGVTYGIVQAGPHIPDGVPYIRTGDMLGGIVRTTGLLRTNREIARSYQRSEVKLGDLVMSIRATVGTIALLPPELDGANLTQGTARIAPGPEVEKHFLLWQIRMPETQRWISQQVKGTTFAEITLARLREMPVFVPALSAQQDFAMMAKRVERLRSVQRESLRQAEHLFASLLHQAFATDS